MYGLIVKLTAVPGARAELIRAMGGEDSETVPGCLSFIIAEDAADENVVWITEVWTSRESHEASLKVLRVNEGLVDAESLIVGFEKVATTRPAQGSSRPLHPPGLA